MKKGIVIVSLGPGDPGLLNMNTVNALREADTLILRTGKHPAAEWLRQEDIAFDTMDSLYGEADDFDLLNDRIAALLIGLAASSAVVYAVADARTDCTVRTLLQKKPEGLSVSAVPGVGSGDAVIFTALQYLKDSVLLSAAASDLSGTRNYDPNRSLLVTELDNPVLAGQIKIFLSEFLDDEQEIILLHDSEPPRPIPLYTLDRLKSIDHRTALLVPGTGFLDRKRHVMADLLELMDRLRAPDGCPWDRAQTHLSLRPYMVEEAWECVAAINENDMNHLCEELGDLLFQIAFHSSVAASYDEFTVNDVVSSICLKMIRRHPHVFGGTPVSDPDSVTETWEKIKRSETGNTTLLGSLDDVSTALPSLKYAAKTLKKLYQSQTFRRSPEDVLRDLSGLAQKAGKDGTAPDTETAEKLLLLCAEYCYSLGMDGEILLHGAVDRMKARLRKAEKELVKDGKSLEHLTFSELGVYLKHVKGEIE